jgi:hypothetical protein
MALTNSRERVVMPLMKLQPDETRRIRSALEKLVGKDAVGRWLKEPNPAFDGATPLQVIERGETDRLWRMIHQLESGNTG